jgi:Ca2+-binding RTX toxin-like protein
MRRAAMAVAMAVFLPAAVSTRAEAGSLKLSADRWGVVYVDYTADPGETNAFGVRWSKVLGRVLIEDTGATRFAVTNETELGDCLRIALRKVACRPAELSFGVELGDRDDTLEIDHTGVPAPPGGDGNYFYVAARGSDGDDEMRVIGALGVFTGGAGADDMSSDYVASYDYGSSAAAVSVTLDGVANDGLAGEGDNVHPAVFDTYIRGSAFGDDLVGSDGPDYIQGADGADQLNGLGGDDKLFGDAGDDEIACGAGADEAYRYGADLIAGDCESVFQL